MRLTLRTMLAYLDDILEPVDAETLGQKIEESKFASDLVHRIRNSTRRLRLGAPKLEGKGMGLDPNTVAEYLDNTLAPEHVPDFEKVCLESDVHLSEVASCHQILTLVLGEPAEIEHAVRERIYRLAADEQKSKSGPSATAGPQSAAAAATAVGSAPPLAEPPPADSVRSGRGVQLKSLAITLLLAFLVVALGLRAIGPFNQDHPLRRLLFGNDSQVAQSPEGAAPATQPAEPQTAGPQTAAAAEEPLPESPQESDSTSAVTPAETDSKLETRPPDPATYEVTPPLEGEGSEPSAAAIEVEAPPAVTPITEPLRPEAPETVDPAVEPAAPETTISVGRYVSEEQLLARREGETDEWFALPADAALAAGDQLLALPTYRPQILLSPDMKVTFSGESRVHLLPPDPDGAPQLGLAYGRAIIMPVGGAAARITLQIGERRAVVLFGDMNSAAALEVRQYLAPGSDPASTTPQTLVTAYATSGQIAWQEEGAPVTLNAGQLLACADLGATEVHNATQLPTWIGRMELSHINRRGSQELREYVTAERPLGLSLMERTEYRRQEVRALACRALTALDIYDPLLKALDDDGQRAQWPSHFDTLRRSVSRNPQSASRLQETADKLYGDQAPVIYRLCWGYSPEQLQDGSAAELVTHLASEQMAIRVLAIWNLERITGITMFSPWLTPDQDRTSRARWQRRLEEGQIVYPTPPSPFSF